MYRAARANDAMTKATKSQAHISIFTP